MNKATNLWLSCYSSKCDLENCPSKGTNYKSRSICSGEIFEIVGDSQYDRKITSGQKIRIDFPRERGKWMGCGYAGSRNYCYKSSCPSGSHVYNFNRCRGEVFTIYAFEKSAGTTINNGDYIMLYIGGVNKYVRFLGDDDEDDASLSNCPGKAPPSNKDFVRCIDYVLRVYKLP